MTNMSFIKEWARLKSEFAHILYDFRNKHKKSIKNILI